MNMRITMNKAAWWAPILLLAAAVSSAAEPVYPVKVSEDGRYFIDQKGGPVFWLEPADG